MPGIFFRSRAGTVVSLSVNIANLLSVLLNPYMPATSQTIQTQLNTPADNNVVYREFVCHLPPGHKIGKVKFNLDPCNKVEKKRRKIMSVVYITNSLMCTWLYCYKTFVSNLCTYTRVKVFNTTFNNIFSYICGGNRSTRSKSPTCHKSLTNFIT